MVFSIITVNRNNAKGLSRTIKSVISQKESSFEFIIIDGASTDGSIEVIKENEQYIDYYISEIDKGIYNAMNKGIAHAKGEFTIFMNSGDEFASNDILTKVEKYGLNTDFIFGGTVKTKNGQQISNEKPEDIITVYTLLYRSICHQSTFTKTTLLKDLGGYDESIKISSDNCFLLKAIAQYNKTYKVLPLYISNYDVTGVSSGNEGLEKMRMEKLNFFKELFPYMYDDYIKMHNIRRFSPLNIIKYIKWRFFK